MCGRVGFYDDQDWKDALRGSNIQYRDDIGQLRASYNITPSQPMATLLNTSVYRYTHFGLIPHWAKDAKFQPINARADSITQKPTFKGPFKSRRCLVPINGFYEWMRTDSEKVPFWITPASAGFFALAGIYDEWHDPSGGDPITGTAIITTDANDLMRPIHDRMPVILHAADWKLWLDPDVREPEAVQLMLVPYSGSMKAIEVSTYVNSPKHDDAKCITPAKRI